MVFTIIIWIILSILVSSHLMKNDRVLRKWQENHNRRYRVMVDIKKFFISFFSPNAKDMGPGIK